MAIRSAKKTKVIIHLSKGGYFEDVFVDGERAEVYVVDDGAIGDRVYRMSLKPDREKVQSFLVGDIGHKDDDRHDAFERRINCFIEGKPHLTVVENV